MLKAIKELLVGRAMTANPTVSISASQCPIGYFIPTSAEQLLSTAFRQQCLQQLWENSALPKDLYEHFYLQPLKQLVTLMQVLPATPQGNMPGKEGWLMLSCRRQRMRSGWLKGTCCPRGLRPKSNRLKMFSGMSWYFMPHYGTTFHFSLSLKGSCRVGKPGYLV